MHWSTEGLRNILSIILIRYTNQQLYNQFKKAYIHNRPITKTDTAQKANLQFHSTQLFKFYYLGSNIRFFIFSLGQLPSVENLKAGMLFRLIWSQDVDYDLSFAVFGWLDTQEITYRGCNIYKVNGSFSDISFFYACT